MRVLILFAFLLMGCSTKSTESLEMNLVFIHGSHFNGNCWNDVRKITDKKYQSIAPTTGNKPIREAA